MKLKKISFLTENVTGDFMQLIEQLKLYAKLVKDAGYIEDKEEFMAAFISNVFEEHKNVSCELLKEILSDRIEKAKKAPKNLEAA